MKEIIIASNNRHKIAEINMLIDKTIPIKILSLNDVGFKEKLEEDFQTFEENAYQKARKIYELYNIPCFSDDSGLEIEALEGAPGVHSAHYSIAEFPNAIDHERVILNTQKVLQKLKDTKNRKAQFRTVICYIENSKPIFFEGIVKGNISNEALGNNGFGYDPIFIPEGYDITFAQMTTNEKNKLSHRARAIKKFIDYISQKL